MTVAAGNSYNPTVVVSKSTVHLFWNDNRDGGLEIYYLRSTDAGVSWGSTRRLTWELAGSELPSAGASGSFVYVMWSDPRDGNWEIYAKRSSDGGSTWSDDQRLTNNPDISSWPSCSVSGSNVHVVWDDMREGNNDVFYKCSRDGGATWEKDLMISQNRFTSSTRPTIAVTDSAVHVVWMDKRDRASGEIYYARNPTGNITVTTGAIAPPTGNVLFLQNYPNPYRSGTTITYSLNRRAHTHVIISDLLGRSVATLLDADEDAGNHSLPFNAMDLAPGLYRCSIESEGRMWTAPMTVLR